MEKAKVQRIVGILVIMSLVIIMLPLLINKNDLITPTASINPLPIASENTVASPASVNTLSSTSTEQSALTDISPTLPTAPITPTSVVTPPIQHAENETLSSGWTVKIGIFREANNVDRLIKQLQKAGYSVITTTVTLPSGGTGTAVMLKPVNNRVAAQKLAKEIKNRLHLYGIVTTYHVSH